MWKQFGFWVRTTKKRKNSCCRSVICTFVILDWRGRGLTHKKKETGRRESFKKEDEICEKENLYKKIKPISAIRVIRESILTKVNIWF